MKKLSVLFLTVALLPFFYACERDNLGVYNPKMKISQIYNEQDGHYLQEQWIWDGSKLSEINFYRKNSNIYSTSHYYYDKDRLSKIENGNEYTEFVYSGKLLKTINTYSGQQLVETYDLAYDKNKLSHILVNKPSKSLAVRSYLPCFIPNGDCLFGQNIAGKAVKADIYNYTSAKVDFFWEGDNITSMKMMLTRPDSVQRLTFSYVYDDKINPMGGFLSLYPDRQLNNNQPQYNLCSRNNALSVSVTDLYDVFSRTESYTYSYEYNKKYPTKVFSTFVNPGNMEEDSTLIFSYMYQ